MEPKTEIYSITRKAYSGNTLIHMENEMKARGYTRHIHLTTADARRLSLDMYCYHYLWHRPEEDG